MPRSLILLQRVEHLLDSFRSDDHHLQVITDLDVPLHSTCKCIPYQLLDRFLGKKLRLLLLKRVPLSAARDVLVLEVDLVIQERHDQACCSTGSPALLPLVRAHGIVAVERTLAFLVQAGQDGMYVVGEESLPVENCREPLRTSRDGHGLAVLVLVHLHHGIQPFLEGIAVRGEAHHGQNDVSTLASLIITADLEDLRNHARVDIVA